MGDGARRVIRFPRIRQIRGLGLAAVGEIEVLLDRLSIGVHEDVVRAEVIREIVEPLVGRRAAAVVEAHEALGAGNPKLCAPLGSSEYDFTG